MENLLIMSNFFLCQNVFKSRLLQMHQKESICGKDLTPPYLSFIMEYLLYIIYLCLFQLYCKLKVKGDFGRLFRKTVSTRKDIQTTGGSTEGTTHTVKDTELPAFSEWINR